MGWQYRHRWWRDRLAGLNIRQSMSRKGNCIDNAATEQVFGHLKDEFYAEFTAMLDEYMVWYRDKRIKTEYGMSIMDKRIQLGLVA